MIHKKMELFIAYVNFSPWKVLWLFIYYSVKYMNESIFTNNKIKFYTFITMVTK